MHKLTVTQTLLRANVHRSKGEIDQARLLYKAVMNAFPNNKRARQGLAAIDRLEGHATAETNPPHDQLNALMALYKKGNLAAVAERAQTLVERFPSAFTVWNILAAAKKGLGRLREAEQGFRKATELNPNDPEAHSNLGATLQDQGKLDEAIKAYQCALKIKPNYASAHNNMGAALREQGKLNEAKKAYHNAIAIAPKYALAYNNLGAIFQGESKLDKAISAYQRALKIRPDYAEAHNNMGVVLKGQGKFDEAIKSYQRALEVRPDYASAYNNMGVALQDQGKLDEAIKAYQRALEIKPDYAEAYNNMGNALQGQGKFDEAIKFYQHALEVRPDYSEAHNNMGNPLQDKGKLDEAIEAYQRAITIRPGYAGAKAQMLYLMKHACDWTNVERFSKDYEDLGIKNDIVSPFSMLSIEDCPRRQMARSKNFAHDKFKRLPVPLPAKSDRKPKRLRVGYFGADFHDHPALYLMSGLLRNHDHSKFEIFVYSYSRKKKGALREQVKCDVDHFIDVAEMSDHEILDLARYNKIDIAIDLNGYTQNTRSDLFQFDLAPVQINYLGYPGTMGANFINYIIADPVVIPKSQRGYYTEYVIYLPHSYLPSDNARKMSSKNTTRSEFGIPENAFVFCCFNSNYKISVREFDIWMRLLNKVEGSVLWLVKSNKWVEKNLRREAEARGIDSKRLVFAEKLPHSEHLARHKHADLFIDTFNYNAHTTASEALWAGLPVVTKQGQQFAARVAASLLNAAGLPELITGTVQEYEELILDLATNRDKLNAIREKLNANRDTLPIFDTTRYTRNFEAGLVRAYDTYFEGNEVKDIWVKDTGQLSVPNPTLV